MMQLTLLLIVLATIAAAAVADRDSADGGLAEDECNLTRSRHARQSLEEMFFTVVRENEYTLPRRCPFHPVRDRYVSFETLRTRNSYSSFSCGICNKMFRTEEFLDLHFVNRHADNITNPDADVCLADYCDMVKCAPSSTDGVGAMAATKREDPVWYLRENDALCQRGGGINERRTLCKAILHQCFPSENGAASHRLRQHFEKAMCEALSCSSAAETNQSASQDIWTLLGIMAFVMVTFVLLLYYGVLYFIYRDSRTKPDLKAARSPTSNVVTQVLDRTETMLRRRRRLY